jgi:hypothetical protein
MPGVLRCPRHLYMYLDAVHVCYANRLSCGLPPTAFDLWDETIRQRTTGMSFPLS